MLVRAFRGRLLTGLAVVLCIAFSWTVDAGARVYWTAHSSIGRAETDGSGVSQSLVATAVGPGAIAVDSHHVYWTEHVAAGFVLARATLDGTGVDESFITGLNTEGAVAVDSQRIYWQDVVSGSPVIARADVDGSHVNRQFIQLPAGSNAGWVAVDGEHVYWTWSTWTQSTSEWVGHIGEAALDGSHVNDALITLGSGIQPAGIAVDDQHIYWTQFDLPGQDYSVGRADLDGSNVNLKLIDHAGEDAGGMAIDGQHIYWAVPGTKSDRGRDRRFQRPPAQIPACASTHWAPPLGFGVKASVGPGMQDPRFG